MRSPKLLWILLAVTAVLILGGIVLHRLFVEREEQAIYHQTLQPIFTSEADRQYRELPLSERHATALRALPVVERLRATGWSYSAKALREPVDAGEGRDLIFELAVGDSELHDCTVNSLADGKSGSCGSFTHVLPAAFRQADDGGEPPTRLQNASLDLYLNAQKPYAASAGKVRLSLGAPADFQFDAQVKVDDEDVHVTQAKLLVPDPKEPGSEIVPVEVGDFSPRTALELQSVKSYRWELTFPMPAALAPAFGNAPDLTVVRADAVVEVSLAQPGYRLEGRLVVLNRKAGAAIVEYHPGDYMAFAVRDLSIPAALPGACFNIDSALFEVDLAEKRLRLMGSSHINTVDSFVCHDEDSEEMSLFTQLALNLSLSAARGLFDLPERLETKGHLVVDWDDSILCGDMSANGRSLLHAAYLGDQQAFQMWAPKSFTAEGVSSDSPLLSSFKLLPAWLMAEWGLPESNPSQCWDSDQGPRTDMRLRLLRPLVPETAPIL